MVIDGLIKQKKQQRRLIFVAFSTFQEGLQCKWREGIYKEMEKNDK
ncbi:hypothetical protein AN402_3865 [Bacillus wiedmannii]|nr:hypothetical protein AN402_3865 [Bacillus wiedmannii]